MAAKGPGHQYVTIISAWPAVRSCTLDASMVAAALESRTGGAPTCGTAPNHVWLLYKKLPRKYILTTSSTTSLGQTLAQKLCVSALKLATFSLPSSSTLFEVVVVVVKRREVVVVKRRVV